MAPRGVTMPAEITAERLTSLESLEVNPLRVDGAAIEALDAVVTWTRRDGS